MLTSTQLGFSKGGWFAGNRGISSPIYSPVERRVELFTAKGQAYTPPALQRIQDGLTVCAGTTPLWPSIRTARHVAGTADAPECLELIKSWVAECDKSHRRCRETGAKPLPDRAILVGAAGDDPRLIESTSGSQEAYIALSHRWGGNVPLQLEKNKLEDFKKCIPFSTIPRTFQHAITICRALGVKYIWIDSLCIIQDSKEDWDVQGSKMDQVYANCLLTLSADSAVNGEAGFLDTIQRQNLLKKTRKLAYRGPAGGKAELFVRSSRAFGSTGGFGRHYDSGDSKLPQNLVEQGSYLMRRGWVLQETFLPGRIIHFLPDEVTWRCPSESRCECQLQPHEGVVHNPLDLENPREISIKELKEFWKEIVEQYTRRILTFYTDRLSAVAGVASVAHSTKPNVDYHAGLWSDELPATLLWTVDRPVILSGQHPSNRVKPPIAPTWSWASVTGYVLFLFWKRNFDRGAWARTTPDLTNIRIESELQGRNKYGSVKNAKLTAEGFVCNVQMWLTGGSDWHFPFRMETTKNDGTLGKSHGLFYPDTDEFLADLQSKRTEGISMVAVSVYESRMFLALKRVKQDESVFERVGVLYCEKQDAVDLACWGRKESLAII